MEVLLNLEEKIVELSSKNCIPYNVAIELITECNWRCSHCYLPSYNNYGMPTEIIINILDQLRQMGTFEITFTGGEIFLREDIMEIVKVAREKFFKIYLYTNVSLLDENQIKELSELYISIGCTVFSINEAIHDKITGVKGSLLKTLKNIMLIKKYNIPLEIKCGITNINFNDYKDIEDFCNANGFVFKPYFDINYKSDGDDLPEKYRISDLQLEKVLIDLYSDENNIIFDHSDDEYICEVLRSQLFINAKGDVFPCDKFFLKLGNVLENEITTIWGNETLAKVREYKWKNLKECNLCSSKKYCKRCPGIALLEDSDMLGKSSLACAVAKTREKLNMQNIYNN